MFSFVAILCASALVSEISGAAIPMWEFLSKDEKMSYLYSTFANQVEDFCELSEMSNCNQELMKYGLKKLKEMHEDHLDIMDPYQRGAHNLIWDSFMAGHEMMKATKKRRPTTTAKPNSYEDQSFGDFGSQSEASAKIDYKVVAPPKGYAIQPQVKLEAPPKGFAYQPQYNILTGVPQYRYPPNGQYVVAQVQPQEQPPAFSVNVDSNVDVDDEYDPSTSYANIPIREEYGSLPLTGPMVIRVYPDGTPVKEDKTPLPHDEDLKQYHLSKAKLPTL